MTSKNNHNNNTNRKHKHQIANFVVQQFSFYVLFVISWSLEVFSPKITEKLID